MPCAKLSVESSVLFADGWGPVGKCTGIAKLWGADRHGKWSIGSVQLAPAAEERPVYLGTEGGFGVLTASSRITLRDGSAVTAGWIPKQSQIGETWFEMPGEAPETAMSGNAWVVVSALRGCAALERGQAFALRRYWPSGQRLGGILPGIVQGVRCGGSEYCVFTPETMERFIAKDWADALTEIVRHCFTSEEGYQVFDRGNAPLIAWYLSALCARRVSYRLSYDALQNTRWVYVDSAADPLPPIARGGCACIGAVNKPTVQVTWTAASWSPVTGSFFLRG
jgi:hypothetical protein